MHRCKSYKSEKYVKAGFVKNEQRYKYKKCGCQFVSTRLKEEANKKN